MGRTTEVARDRADDQTKTVLPTEIARGVYMRNVPGLRALKLMHLMIATAGGRMADDVQHQIRLSDIRGIVGMAHYDRATLTPLLEELSATVLTYDDRERQEIVISGFLDVARVNYRDEASGDLLVTWTFRGGFKEMAAKSDHWAIIDRQTVFHLTSKYAALLFQHVSSLTRLDHVQSKSFTIPELRAMLGVPEGKYERFSNLNSWALKPAIAEINQLSRLHLTATMRKVGRTVAEVTISWEVKDDLGAVKRELGAASTGRKARRDGTAEHVAVAFPETGGIAYSPHWQELKRAAGCNKDDQLIASDFRRFCGERGIALDARNVEKVFSDYCAKVGRV